MGLLELVITVEISRRVQDKMHQFYYIKYLKMSCPKGMRLAEDDYLKVSPDSKELNY